MYSAFFELLDQLYRKGYAKALEMESPTVFNLYYTQFLKTYNN